MAAILLAGCTVVYRSTPAKHPLQYVIVMAAASLQAPFDRMSTKLKAQQNMSVQFLYAGTQMLVSQLNAGGKADVFASADTQHMSQVSAAGLVQGSAKVFAYNKLEMVVARGNPKGVRTLSDLARSNLVVVLADKSVPAGNYSQQILTKAGVTVHPASLEQNVSSVLAKVALGDADAGIVYASDIRTNKSVDGVVIPDSQNIVAEYPIAILKMANFSVAKNFVDYVLSPDGQAILKAAGFQVQ